MSDEPKTNPFAKGLSQSLIVLVLLQVGLGVLLHSRYSPNVAGAHESVSQMRNEALTRWLTGTHYWGSALLLALSALSVLSLAWSGRFKESTRVWYASLMVGTGAFLLQVTGNLLPMDRHDVQTAIAEAGVAYRLPLLGPTASEFLLQGPALGEPTLTGWYFAHRWVFPCLVGLGVLLLLPGSWKLKGTAWIALLPAAMAAALGILFGAPTGFAATLDDFGMQTATVSWYAWPMHGALKATDAWLHQGWIGAALVPGLLGGFLALLPWIGKKWPLGACRAALFAFVAFFGVSAALFGGRPAPLTGNQDVEISLSTGVPRAADLERPDAEMAAKGFEVFSKAGCAGCHGKNGEGAGPYPNLRKLAARNPDPVWLERFITKPDSVRPSSKMPAFKSLGAERIRQIVAWIRMPKE